MNAGGILASMCFPSFPGFAARLFATEDPDFSLALVRAYNDWHIDEWCGGLPGRFIPMALPAIWDAELCAAEVRRVAKRGVIPSPSPRTRPRSAIRASTTRYWTRCGRRLSTPTP